MFWTHHRYRASLRGVSGPKGSIRLRQPIALDAAEEEWFIVFESEFAPVICQLIVTVEAPPGQFIVFGPLASAPKGQVHAVHVLGTGTFRLNEQVALLFCWACIWIIQR